MASPVTGTASALEKQQAQVAGVQHSDIRPDRGNGAIRMNSEAQYREYGGYERPQYLRVIANPSPLGLFSFASTTMILSFINADVRGVGTPNIIVSMALAVGGLAQFLAGQWEFVCGNTFGATAFTSYGAFWISFALIYWPNSGILAAYEGNAASELHNVLGFYLMTWFIFTFIMFLGSLRTTVALASLFFFLTITFMLLMIGEYAESTGCHKAGGVFGIITAAIAYYAAASGILAPQSSYFVLPVGDLPKRRD